MARDKSSERIGIGLVVLAGIAAVFFFIAPAIMFLFWVVLRYRLFADSDSLWNPRGFMLFDDEKRKLKYAWDQLEAKKKLVRDLRKQGKDEGISTNKDGTFSARSQRGKELKVALEKLDLEIRDLDWASIELASRPRREWEAYTSVYAKEKSLLVGLLAFAGCGLYFGYISDGGLFSAITNYFKLPYDYWYGNPLDFITAIKMLGAGVIGFAVIYIIFRVAFHFYQPVQYVRYDDLIEVVGSPATSTVPAYISAPQTKTSVKKEHIPAIKVMKDFFKHRQGSAFKEHAKAAVLWCTEMVDEKKQEYAASYEDFCAKEHSEEVMYDVSGLSYEVVDFNNNSATVKVGGKMAAWVGADSTETQFGPFLYTLIQENNSWKIQSVQE